MQLLNPIKRAWNNLFHAEVTTTHAHAEDLLISLLNMAWFVEARDPYTGGHLWRVSRYALLLAQSAGLQREMVAQIAIGGFLHDLGKIAVPDAILRKADKLTEEEYAVIKTHPQTGHNLLSGHPLAHIVRDAVLLHHERPDGMGYPFGLAAPDIPIMAKIVAICDAFDAMTSHRPYRVGMPKQKALAIIEQFYGQQFDPYYGQRFLSLADSGHFESIIGHSDHGILLQKCPMCGPTVVINRENQIGDHIFCRNCGGEFLVSNDSTGLTASATGRQGAPHQLTPKLEVNMVTSVVHQHLGLMGVNAFIDKLNKSKQQNNILK